MSFTPKFVDLVRNFTRVEGTGRVVLGAAISGYGGMADALQPGDQFYYCIQGIDRPDEREVGRGTMQANGTISRQPVTRPLTNFSRGSKTIALVTAADWFKRMQPSRKGPIVISID